MDCTVRFRSLAWGYERLPEPLASVHLLACAILLLHRAIQTFMQSP